MPEQHVRVELERSGGYAGLRRCASLDTSTLPPDQATRLRSLVGGIDLRMLAGIHADPGLPRLDMVIDVGEGPVRASLNDNTVPAEVRPVVQWLDQRLQPC